MDVSTSKIQDSNYRQVRIRSSRLIMGVMETSNRTVHAPCAVAHSGGSLGKSAPIPTSRAGNNLGRIGGQDVQGLVLSFYAWDWIHINYTLPLIVSYTKWFLSKAYVCISRHNRGGSENTCTTTMYIVVPCKYMKSTEQ